MEDKWRDETRRNRQTPPLMVWNNRRWDSGRLRRECFQHFLQLTERSQMSLLPSNQLLHTVTNQTTLLTMTACCVSQTINFTFCGKGDRKRLCFYTSMTRTKLTNVCQIKVRKMTERDTCLLCHFTFSKYISITTRRTKTQADRKSCNIIIW